jgi:hypothetical protein
MSCQMHHVSHVRRAAVTDDLTPGRGGAKARLAWGSERQRRGA